METTKFETIKRIACDVDPVLQLLNLRKKGYTFAFTPDFAEIHSYMFPLKDIQKALDRNDKSLINTATRYWYASRLLLQTYSTKKYIIPPYWAEISQKMESMRVLSTKAAIDFTMKPEDLIEITDNVMMTPGLIDALEEFEKSPNLDIAKKALVLARGFAGPISILFEIVGGTWHHGVKRLDQLWKNRMIEDARNIYNINGIETLRESAHWAIQIEEARKSTSREGYRYAAVIDGWAIEYLKHANMLTRKEPGKYPILIFISRATEVSNILKQQLEFIFSPEDRIQTFWSPDTFLAFQIIEQIPKNKYEDNDYEIKIQAAKDFNAIAHLLERPNTSVQELQDDCITQANQISAQVWESVNKTASDIENLSLFNADFNADIYRDWSLPENGAEKNSESFLSHDLVDFIRRLSKMIIGKRDEISIKVNDELNELWSEMRSADEMLVQVESARTFVTSRPKIRIDQIGGSNYVVARMPELSLWLKFRSEAVTQLIQKLILEQNKPEIADCYLALLQEITQNDFDPEFPLLIALIYIFLNDFENAKEQLALIPETLAISILLEKSILKSAISHLEKRNLQGAIQGINWFIEKEIRDPRLSKMIGVLAWDIWIDKHEPKYIQEAIKYTQEAINTPIPESRFKFECMNNLTFFHISAFDQGEINLSVIEEDLNNLNTFINNKVNDVNEEAKTPEVLHTLGVLKSKIGWNNKEATLIESAINDLKNASIARTSFQNNILKDLDWAQQKYNELIQKRNL